VANSASRDGVTDGVAMANCHLCPSLFSPLTILKRSKTSDPDFRERVMVDPWADLFRRIAD
jgi:hypothetical protein